MTIRPQFFGRWLAAAIFLAIAAVIFSIVVRALATGDLLSGALLLILGLVVLGLGVMSPTIFIRVDGSTITTGTVLAKRRYDRGQVAGIRATHSPLNNLTYFLRADGTAVFATSGYVWGEQRLRQLADYMQVPLEW